MFCSDSDYKVRKIVYAIYEILLKIEKISCTVNFEKEVKINNYLRNPESTIECGTLFFIGLCPSFCFVFKGSPKDKLRIK